MLKKLIYLLLFLLITITAIYFFYLKPRLPVVNGYAAKKACSCLFLADRTLESIVETDLDVFPMQLVNIQVDKEKKAVDVSFFGQNKVRAQMVEGLGCTLVGDRAPKLMNMKVGHMNRPQPLVPTPKEWPHGNEMPLAQSQNINYQKLDKAFDLAFDKGNAWEKKTRALVVIHNGQLIKEQYSPGFDKDTEILGWSMTKSITNILFGILAKEGAISVDENKLLEAWENDDRKNITLDNLLRMSSGLAWEEDYANISTVTDMLFESDDMSASAAEHKIDDKPGTVWEYSSGTTNILSGILKNKFKSHTEYLGFPYRNLFYKLNMSNVTLEADASGHYVLSSYCYAPPREWAKLGLLYLNEGIWDNGNSMDTIFTKEWHDYSLTPTDNSDGKYGAHIWLNTDNVFYEDVPGDMYYFSGYEGQYVIMIPSKDLVIVRMGLSKGPAFDYNAVVSAICESVH